MKKECWNELTFSLAFFSLVAVALLVDTANALKTKTTNRPIVLAACESSFVPARLDGFLSILLPSMISILSANTSSLDVLLEKWNARRSCRSGQIENRWVVATTSKKLEYVTISNSDDDRRWIAWTDSN